MNSDMKRAIIIGATSGIGREVAKQLLLQGWRLGIAGRRLPALEALQSSAPDLIEIAVLDVTQPDATPKLNNLIRRVGGMDLFLLSSGIGYQNMELNPDIELDTARTNVEGFMRRPPSGTGTASPRRTFRRRCGTATGLHIRRGCPRSRRR